MTEPLPPAGAEAPDASPDGRAPQPRFGLTTFSVEGRRAPGLFVVGWLAAAIGFGLVTLSQIGMSGAIGAIAWVLGLATAALGLVLLGGSQTIEGRAAGVDDAGPSPWLVLLAAVIVLGLLAVVVGLPLLALGASIPREVGDLVGVGVQAAAFVTVLRLMVVATGVMRWTAMGLSGRLGDAARGVSVGAVYAGPVILVAAFLANLAVQIVGVVPPSPLPPTGTASGLVLHLIAGALIAPVAEELLFRGYALTAWQRTVGTRAAIVRSALAFVLAHVVFVGGAGFREGASLAFVAGIVRIPAALALGWLYVRTGSLWAPIGLHAAYNAVLIILGESASGLSLG